MSGSAVPSEETPSRVCQGCGSEVPASSESALCPKCVLQLAMGESTAGGGSGTGSPGNWEPPPVEKLQELLPQYEIESLIGRGGMGAVYRGRQVSLDRIVAIKILPETLSDSIVDEHRFGERFQLEARAMASLDHPAIISVFNFGETSEGHLYFVMEFVDGMDIQKYIELSGGRVSAEHSVAIVSHVLDALDYAHEKGIVHRDIKPANVLINREGKVKIADFGLAKQMVGGEEAARTSLTMSNVALGTPDYMAPESLEQNAVPDGRADLYAVGVMFYQMLTGKLPRGIFKLPSERDRELDERIDEIITLAMESDPTSRFQSATEFRLKLDELASKPVERIDAELQTGEIEAPAQQFDFTEPGLRRSESAKRHAPVPARKENMVGSIIGVVVAVLAIGGVLSWWIFKPGSASLQSFDSAGGDNTRIIPSSSATNLEPSQGKDASWPTGPHFKSGGRFRAWSSIPNDPAINLGKLQKIEDPKQLYMHGSGWVVLREGGIVIDNNKMTNSSNTRRIVRGYYDYFGLLSKEGKLSFYSPRKISGHAYRIPSDLGPVKEAYMGFWNREALLEDGTLRVWGLAHDGVETKDNPEWNEKPSIPSGRKVTDLYSCDQAVAVRLDDGTLRLWTNTEGEFDLGKGFSSQDYDDFSITREWLFGRSARDSSVHAFPLRKNAKPLAPIPSSTRIISGERAILAMMEDGTVDVSQNCRDLFPNIAEALSHVSVARPGLISLHMAVQGRPQVCRFFWFDSRGEKRDEGRSENLSSTATASPATNQATRGDSRIDGLVANGEWQDVLQAIARSPSYSEGEWESDETGLRVSSDGRNGEGDSVRGIEIGAMASYDARIQFTATPRAKPVAIGVMLPTPAGGTSIFLFDGNLSGGLEKSPGSNRPIPTGSRATMPYKIGDGKKHELRVSIANDRLRVSIDESDFLSFSVSDWSQVNQRFLHPGDAPLIGLRAENTDIQFHAFEIRIPKVEGNLTSMPRLPKRIDGLVANGEWQDVLPLIAKGEQSRWNDRNEIKGEVEYINDHLTIKNRVNVGIAIPSAPLSNYTARIRFISEKANSLAVFLPTPTGGMGFGFILRKENTMGIFDSTDVDLANINSSRKALPLEFQTGSEQELSVTIRDSGISAKLDGVDVYDWENREWSTIAQPAGWTPVHPVSIGVGANGGTTQISSFEIQVSPVSDSEKQVPALTPLPIPDIPEVRSRVSNYQEARRKQLVTLAGSYRANLKEAEAAAVKAGDLKPVEAIRKMMGRIDGRVAEYENLPSEGKVKPLPALPKLDDDVPPALVRLRSIFDTEAEKIETNLLTLLGQSLEKVQSDFVKANRIEEARVVEEYRKYLANPNSIIVRTSSPSESPPHIPKEPSAQPILRLVESKGIWDQAPFNAYTDLTFHKGSWFCIFREADDKRISNEGSIRVLGSTDGIQWDSLALVTDSKQDLRDPKISVTPDERLMVTSGSKIASNRDFIQSKAWFSSDAGKTWTTATNIGDPGYWLWRSVWHKGFCYSMGYSVNRSTPPRLYRSHDGKNLESFVPALNLENTAGEHGMIFRRDGTAICLFRHDFGDKRAILGKASSPYQSWTWSKLDRQIAGPNLIELPDGNILAAGRLYDGSKRTSLLWLDPTDGKLEECLQLPSGGETGYPGLVWKDDHLWVSYYSSHEGKPSIYVAKVAFDSSVAGTGLSRQRIR